jgi:hypothetical protein
MSVGLTETSLSPTLNLEVVVVEEEVVVVEVVVRVEVVVVGLLPLDLNNF